MTVAGNFLYEETNMMAVNGGTSTCECLQSNFQISMIYVKKSRFLLQLY